MATLDPNQRPMASSSRRSSSSSDKLKRGFKKLFKPFTKNKAKMREERVHIPEPIQWRTSAREVGFEERVSAPDLGTSGWGENSWQRVKPQRRQHVEAPPKWDVFRSSIQQQQIEAHAQDYDVQASRQSGNGALNRLSVQTRSTSTRALFNFGNRASLSPAPSPTRTQAPPSTTTPTHGSASETLLSGTLSSAPPSPHPRTQLTPSHRTPSMSGSIPRTQLTPSARTPSGSHSLPHNPRISSHRTPSTISATSSYRSISQPFTTHHHPSGTSFTTSGINVNALPKCRIPSSGVSGSGSSYTNQGVRVGSDGYVGKWASPRKISGGKGGEAGGGEGEVWKGHPALRVRPREADVSTGSPQRRGGGSGWSGRGRIGMAM
ncbi:hypothetical protein K458DRAFT_56665 [Lentithecium fluviatile CBS 122367]|uniref:Uncharacterized protein n=1 Tax=Lentithecium fluviatile CBS 122367 TaxID=1168545 RepID=A0A6G1IY34_9PLEO|nr:hypothetical protein K458DRAFT_56665 [Lentithecium fluviatile CBS 122367]